MKFGTYEAQDGVQIRYAVAAVQDGKPLVLANGRGEFIEKYAEVIRELNARGFTVWTFDWRGQGLSTRLLPNRQKGYVGTFDEYLSDWDGWMNEVVQPSLTQKPQLLAHSMGGHLALRYLAEHPGRFERAVVIAPLVQFPVATARSLMVWILRFLRWVGIGRWYFVRGDYDEAGPSFGGNRLTSDPERFQMMADCVRANPKLALGGVTIHWLVKAADSIEALYRSAHQITDPVLLIAPEDEQIVDGEASVEMMSRLPQGEVLNIKGSKHEVLFETTPIRDQFWARLDSFLGVA